MPGYSKAPRGLSVLLQVTGIFTGITTSPGLRPRQLPNHFTIRAGRNLPDKEFRYLRTVIVTAAVHRRPVFLVNSCLGLFTAARFPSGCLPLQVARAPLLPKLRGHFAEFLSQSCPVGLKFLTLSTCVGLQYGRCFPK